MVFACPVLPVSDTLESPVFVGPEVTDPEPLPDFAVPEVFSLDAAVPLAPTLLAKAFADSDAVPWCVSLMALGIYN